MYLQDQIRRAKDLFTGETYSEQLSKFQNDHDELLNALNQNPETITNEKPKLTVNRASSYTAVNKIPNINGITDYALYTNALKYTDEKSLKTNPDFSALFTQSNELRKRFGNKVEAKLAIVSIWNAIFADEFAEKLDVSVEGFDDLKARLAELGPTTNFDMQVPKSFLNHFLKIVAHEYVSATSAAISFRFY